jgi:large repetitive protein
MKTRLRFLAMLVLIGFNSMFGQFSADRPDLRLCGSPPNYYLDYYNCTSNNYTLVDVFLSLTDVNGVPLNNTTCTIGTPQDLYVMLDYTSNSASAVHHARMFADLNIEGQGTIALNVDFRTVQPGAGQILLYGPFEWVCGQEITLSRILIVWRTNGDDTELVPYDCSSYNKTQCDLPDNIAVTAPLAVEFDYTACTVGNLTTVNFNSTTSGGTPDYTYAWDFNGDNITDSTLENPTYVYNNLTAATAKLTVTDALFLSNSYSVPIIYPDEIQVTPTLSPVGCSASNDGAISLAVSGGNSPYTFLWNNGATTQNIIGLSGGTYEVDITDASGCVKTEVYNLLNGDNVNPVLTISANETIQGCSTADLAIGHLPFSSSLVTIDLITLQNAGGTATDDSTITSITYQDATSGSCPILVTRTFTVTDACNNSASIQKIFTIEDTTPPTATAPSNVTGLQCISNVPVADVNVITDETDNCGGLVTITVADTNNGGTGCLGNPYIVTRTYTLKDVCNNTSTLVQTFTVEDTTSPVFVEALPEPITVECNAIPAPATLTATDTCGTATVSFNETSTAVVGTCASYTITRTWTATDLCNLTTTHTQIITVQDNSIPIFVEALPNDVTVECNAIPTPVTLTATDLCGTANVTFAEVRTDGTCANEYTLTRTWIATDLCGNNTIHNQIITVQDNSNPTFSGVLPNDLTVECNAIPTPVTLTATDLCGTANVTFAEIRTDGTCANEYTLTRTWTATDLCGNNTIHNQIITVQDNSNPTFSGVLPNDVTVECNAIPIAVTLTATDLCGTANVTFAEVRTDGTCANEYTLTRTWTATDLCGNNTIHNQIISVQDNSNPTFSGVLPNDVTVECNAIPTPVILTATDVCGTANVTFAEVRTDGTCVNEYTLTRTWTATDLCGNNTIHNQIITVQDNSNPTFTGVLPTDITVECNAVPTPVTLTATDLCGTANVTFAEVRTDGTCANEYTLTRTWTATDLCGNITTHNQVITVQDNSNPTFSGVLPNDVTVECNAIPIPVTLTATDLCGTANVTFAEVRTDGTCANEYTLTRTWTATDLCGNNTIHNQIITVQDNSNPTFSGVLPNDVTVECNAIPTPVILTATDLCGTANVTFAEVRTDGTCANEYTLTRTWTATDLCGNNTIHNQIITVQDNTNPTFTGVLPTDITVECNAVPTPVTLTATDLCGTANVTFAEVRTDGTCANEYTLTRTWTATDLCGNNTIHTQIITVQDNTNPTFTGVLPTDITVECNAVPTPVTLTATDLCGTANVTFAEVRTDGTCANEYTLTRTWTATDLCGNITTHNQVITVQDNSNPTFVEALPAAITVECNAVPTPVTLTATDLCGTANVTFAEVRTDGTCANEYTLTRTWTATDLCGNNTIHTQIITVQDSTNPVFVTSLPANITIECNTTIPNIPNLTATDNCGSATVTFTEQVISGNCGNESEIIRTWTATDECGNETIHTQVITIQDTTAPVFTGIIPSAVVYAYCDGIPNVATVTASDNCGNSTIAFSETRLDGDCINKYDLNRTWTATDDCGNVATFTQIIHVACDIKIYNAVSPNNDGMNDIFYIEGIECYPNNSVEIYNRWGVKIYATKGYDNVTRVFNGYSNEHSSISGNDLLPAGTYFYILKYEYDLYGTEKQNIEKSGYLYIQSK